MAPRQCHGFLSGTRFLTVRPCSHTWHIAQLRSHDRLNTGHHINTLAKVFPRGLQLPPNNDASFIEALPFTHNRVWLGNSSAASNQAWLRAAGIDLAVCCLPHWHHCRPEFPRDIWSIEWPFSPHDRTWESFVATADAKVEELRRCLSKVKNILFFCKRGRHRSACALACFLIAGPPTEPGSAKGVMEMMQSRRPIVQPDAQLGACLG